MSDGDQVAEFVMLIGMMVLVGSALLVRRMPIGKSLKLFGFWAIIFLVVFIAFTLRDDFADLGRRVMDETSGEQAAVQSGETMRIRQSLDGHFRVDAQVNGETVRFLIDSGATTTTVSAETARRIGIEAGGGFPVVVQTANGSVTMQRAQIERLRLGMIQRDDLSILIAEGLGDTNILGMNFLSSLSGWGVEDQWLALRP